MHFLYTLVTNSKASDLAASLDSIIDKKKFGAILEYPTTVKGSDGTVDADWPPQYERITAG